ncbi:sensor histidine kinase [Runella aurantiaca]|uniref:sensor histidine kinase n=1 Tax=Runella aurantiaca TaxID=2282308 RepID=UPI0011C032C9|nr:sensor histidine kinase [Runella aurantiaca]
MDDKPVGAFTQGFRHGFGRIRPENGRTFTKFLNFAHRFNKTQVNSTLMSSSNNHWLTSFFGKNLYIFLSLLFSIPLFLMIETYVKAIGIHEDEAVAATVTFLFVIGVFAGRYLSQLWISSTQPISNEIIIGVILLIIGCVVGLFALPFQGNKATQLLFWIPFVFVPLALGTLIKMVRHNVQHQLREAQQVAAQSKSELQLLQSQLSPHFLFNTLNNLYGLSITQHEKIPPLLLKLADLLRYSVYDAKEVFVPLQDELAYINNYIDFEKIRIGERLLLRAAIESLPKPDIKIAPMLLIVFIENAFKHSKNTVDETIFVDLTLKTWSDSILFSVKNSYNPTKQSESTPEKHSGFGLVSVRKRLELLYPNQYDLKIEAKDGFYHVMLQLKMK